MTSLLLQPVPDLALARFKPHATSEFQTPRLLYLPDREYRNSLADECLDYIESVGFFLDPWQAFLTWLSLLDAPDQTWFLREFGYLVPRQNGKGGILTARCITDLFYLPCFDSYGKEKPRLVVYTAHQFKTATEAFERMKEVIDGSDELRKLMKKDRNGGVRNSALDKGFDLANGNRMRYLARSRGGSGRGLSIDTLLTDEMQELPLPAWDALKFTQRAMPNPQRLMTGTVPDAENNHAVWTATRDKGRGGKSDTAGWVEYSVDPDDPQTRHDMTKPASFGSDVDPTFEYALATNPAFGIRVSPATLKDDAEGGADSYRREVICYWPGSEGSQMLLANWPILHDSASAPVGPVALAVEVAEDRSWGSILAVAPRADDYDRFHIEMIDYRAGTDWMVDRIEDLMNRHEVQVLVLDKGGPAGTLAIELEEYEVPFRTLTFSEIAWACGSLFDLVKQNRVSWLRHPALTQAAKATKWRAAGKVFERRVETDIGPMMAAAFGVVAVLAGMVPDVPVAKKQPRPSNIVYGFN